MRLFSMMALLLGLLVARGSADENPQPTPPTEGGKPSAMPQLLPDPTNSGSWNGRPTMLPDVLPEARPAGSVVLYSDFYLLRAVRSGSEYALIDPNTDGVPEGTIRALRGDYSSGFRVGGRYRPGRRDWDIGGAYAYWRGRDTEFLVAPSGGMLHTTLTRPGLIETAEVASSSTRWAWDVYDLELGNEFSRTESACIRACFGVRIADLGMTSTTLYDGRDAALARVATGQQFVGAGPTIGGEAEWRLGRFLQLFAQARGGTVVGLLETSWRESNFDDQIVHADVWLGRQQAVPMLELVLGGSLRIRRLQFHAGYTVATWFQLFQQIDFPDDLNEGKTTTRFTPTSLDGFMLRLAFRF